MHTYERVYVHVRVYARVRASACARLACVGERYAVPRGAIRRITTRDTPYLFLDPLEGPELNERLSDPEMRKKFCLFGRFGRLYARTFSWRSYDV